MTDKDEGLLLTVSVVGGTGKEGSGLAMRWALHGYRVIIGSRDGDKAKARAAVLIGRQWGLAGPYASLAAVALCGLKTVVPIDSSVLAADGNNAG